VTEIRPYRTSDLRRLHAIDQAAFEPSLAWSMAELRAYVCGRGVHTLVAEERGEAVGFISGRVGRAGVGRISTLDILPAEQRKGLGSRLLEALESRLWREGARWILLETVTGPATARAFYERHGYVVLERLPHYYFSGGGGQDAWLMGKERAPALAPDGERSGGE
jgi:ribosomal protein S18 acetylase RimI-like enzyme